MFAQYAELHSAGLDQSRLIALLEKEDLAVLVANKPRKCLLHNRLPDLAHERQPDPVLVAQCLPLRRRHRAGRGPAPRLLGVLSPGRER